MSVHTTGTPYFFSVQTPSMNNYVQQENERLASLKSFKILDSLPEEDYDAITSLAASICDTEFSLVSFVDEERQWFKSHYGLEVKETPVSYSFCAHAIRQSTEIFIIPDARDDVRFATNPLVMDEPGIVFYAGVPLVDDDGYSLGTLCVIDRRKRELNNQQIDALKTLARQVMNLLRLRKNKRELERNTRKLEEKNRELQSFAYRVANDIRNPLSSIAVLAKDLAKQMQRKNNDEALMLNVIHESAAKLNQTVNGILQFSLSQEKLEKEKSQVNLVELTDDLRNLFHLEKDLIIELYSTIDEIFVNRPALETIFINLISNAIQFNQKPSVQVVIEAELAGDHYKIRMLDNGPALSAYTRERLGNSFNLTEGDKREDSIGLSTVKSLVEGMGGSLKVISRPKQWTAFTILLPVK